MWKTWREDSKFGKSGHSFIKDRMTFYWEPSVLSLDIDL